MNAAKIPNKRRSVNSKGKINQIPAFLLKHGSDIAKAAKACNVSSPLMVDRFRLICLFIYENPKSFSWPSKPVPSVTDKVGLEQIAKKFFGSRNSRYSPSAPGTKPDPAVSLVLRASYKYTKKATERIKIEHQHSMLAENAVGDRLERYVAKVIETPDSGWVWCSGNFVAAGDFIGRRESGKWVVLQVKNKNTTENSSSSKVRVGTKIGKWYRMIAKSGNTRWAEFPDIRFSAKMSEKDFLASIV